MKGLLYKDMLMLLRQYRNFVFIFLVFLIVGVIPGNESYFNIYAIFLLSVFSLSSLRADEMSGWNRYCDILPLSGKTVVTSYYVENYSLLTLGVLLYLILSLMDAKHPVLNAFHIENTDAGKTVRKEEVIIIKEENGNG